MLDILLKISFIICLLAMGGIAIVKLIQMIKDEFD